MDQIGIGKSPKRKEDLRFVTGKGQYVSDIKRPNMRAGVFVRSPHAHAKIVSVDIDEAMQMPGVVAVLTGADMVADKVGGLPVGWAIEDRHGEPCKEPAHPPIAHEKVRHVGDAVAFVVADTEEHAEAAAEAVVVDYEELPHVIGLAEAIEDGAPLVHDDVPGNLCADWEMGDQAAVDEAFANAANITRLELVNQRLVGNPMEPRAAIGEFEPERDQYTLYTTSQFPHVVRLLMGEFVLGIPQHKLRVVAPDVGGGFGVKQFLYAEEVVVSWAAKKLGGAVKWVARRSEGFVSDAHGRDHVTVAELATDAEGVFLGLRVNTLANMGGYLSTFGPNIPTNLYAPLLSGVYRIPAIHCEVKAIFTNTVPVDAYRGAGRPEATFVVERIVEMAAEELGIDKLEIRRRNMIKNEEFPYQTPMVIEYDSGDPIACLDRCEVLADVAGFHERRARSEAKGLLRGIGASTYIEACGLAPSRLAIKMGARSGLYESATVRVHPSGTVTVLIGTHNHGQGHETTFAQIVSERLGVPFDNIDIVFGDTDKVQHGLGTYGSRSLVVGGSALNKAVDKVVEKCRKIAAYQFDVDVDDVVFDNGEFSVEGTNKKVLFPEIAGSAYVPANFPLETLEPGLEEQAYYDPVNFTYPGGAHICEVEVDPRSGTVKLESYTAVDDVGTVINPMIVEGQLQGGIVQGIGQALYEHGVYEADSGQLIAGSFMDYCMPRADNFPNIVSETLSTSCAHTPMGVKGCGECGTIGSPPAVINAIVDALKPFGVRHMDMPATPNRVWNTIQQSAVPAAAE